MVTFPPFVSHHLFVKFCPLICLPSCVFHCLSVYPLSGMVLGFFHLSFIMRLPSSV